MQRHRFFIFLMAVGLVLILNGCGGTVLPPMVPEPLSIDLETALAELQAITNISDSILVSDLVFTPAGETERLHGATSCGRTKCRTTVSGRSFLVYGLNTGDDPDFEGLSSEPVVNLGEFEQYRGVSLGAFRERTYQREEDEFRGLPVKVEIDTDILSYEGWMQYSRFGVQINNITHGFVQVGQNQRDYTGQRYAVGTSMGQLSETNPVDGNATWEGVMVGGRISETAAIGKPVRGDATLTFDFADAELDVALTNIRTLPIVQVQETYDDMTWENLAVRDGRFGGGFDDPTIEGRFYGPNHEEVGGIFQRNRIVGAFGAQREPPMGDPSMGEGM